MPKEAEISCKNVFKCEDKSALKKEFNQKWIELINQLEKSKGQVLPVKRETNLSQLFIISVGGMFVLSSL